MQFVYRIPMEESDEAAERARLDLINADSMAHVYIEHAARKYMPSRLLIVPIFIVCVVFFYVLFAFISAGILTLLFNIHYLDTERTQNVAVTIAISGIISSLITMYYIWKHYYSRAKSRAASDLGKHLAATRYELGFTHQNVSAARAIPATGTNLIDTP